MDTETTRRPPTAMAFYHPKGVVPAWRQALKYAGKQGRIATLPDILDARIASPDLDGPAWAEFYVTASAEYVGRSKGGSPIAIVAHGIGPMSTLDGVLAAYAYEYKDKKGERRGGRIPTRAFRDLESGKFGDVSIVDLFQVWKRREYSFSNHPVSHLEIAEEPLWQARLGARWKRYCDRHTAHANEWEMGRRCERRFAPCILAMDDASNCAYGMRELFDHLMREAPGMAVGHLLGIDGVTICRHDYRGPARNYSERRDSYSSEVSCHEWGDNARMVGIRDAEVTAIHPGIGDIEQRMQFQSFDLLRPCKMTRNVHGLHALMEVGHLLFTQYEKTGATPDTGEPKHRVTSASSVGEVMTFRSRIGAMHGTLKYGMRDVVRIAPPKANAYKLAGQPTITKIDGQRYHEVPVQFYQVEIDHARRMLRADEIYDDHDLIMKLTEDDD